MLIALGCVFGLALIAPAVHCWTRRTAHWCLGAAAAGLTAYFATLAPGVAGGIPISIAHDWVPALGTRLSLFADGLALLFALIIVGIGALVLIFSGAYLAGHRQLGSFYGFLLLFMGSMLGVVLADNVILLFVFWELTSLSSYLLIGFDHERPAARAAALQALLVTGTGGLALLAGLLLLATAGGGFELSELVSQAGAIRQHAFYGPIVVLVLLGAFTKSAQFPFHFWLPNAMEAPAPVSAYLHSATMVKAGVFLVARLTPILGGTTVWTYPIVVVGAITLLVGAAQALTQPALKRILAYSTVSVLGMLMMLLGVSTDAAVRAAIVLLAAHALYKGALFMVAGAVSHATGESDADRLGGLRRAMPLTAAAALLAAVSMAGLPPAFGFVGKELVYEAALHAAWLSRVLTAATVLSGMLLFAVALVVGVRPFLGAATPTHCVPHDSSPALLLGPAILSVLGLLLGLWPDLAARSLLAPAALAIGSENLSLHLSLWHGWNPGLALSALTVVGGLVVYGARAVPLRAARRFSTWARVGPAGAYEAGLVALNAVARLQTRILQSGYLRTYLAITLLCVVASVGYPLYVHGRPHLPTAAVGAHYSEIIVAVLVLLAALAAVRSRSRLAAIAALGAVGYGVALLFVFFGAPDLAMTQFLIETLTVILFVLVFYHLPRFSVFSGPATRARDAVLALVVGGLMGSLVLAADITRAHEPISDYFLRNAYELAHGRNVVNVILVDFRALDTLGEITVISTAAVGVYALLKLRPQREPAR